MTTRMTAEAPVIQPATDQTLAEQTRSDARDAYATWAVRNDLNPDDGATRDRFIDLMMGRQVAPVGWTVSGDGQTIPVPAPCPSWCSSHAEFLAENNGVLDVAEIGTHTSEAFGGTLDEIRNYVSHVAERDGGSDCTARIRQTQRLEGARGWWGNESAPHIELAVSDRLTMTRASLDMTTGEARVFAAQVLALCDKVDLTP